MNWITNYVRPKINSMLGRREVPENLWIKCPETGEMVFHRDLEENKWVIPQSGYHMKMPAKARLKDLFDGGIYEALPQPKVAQDPLKFRDSKKYVDRLRDSRAKTELEDTIVAGVGLVQGVKLVAVAHEFNFIGGSLGMAAGEAIVKAFERAIAEKCALVIFPASGGAIGTVVRDHPALRGFPHEGFCDLQFYNLIEGAHSFPLDNFPKDLHPIIGAIRTTSSFLSKQKNLSRTGYVFEAKAGKGKLLVTTLRIRENFDEDYPEAMYLFDRLLRYCLSDDFAPPAALNDEQVRMLVRD